MNELCFHGQGWPVAAKKLLKKSNQDKEGSSSPYVFFPWPTEFNRLVIRKILN